MVRVGLAGAIALGLGAIFLSGEAQAGAFCGAGFLVLLSSWAYIGRRLRQGGQGDLITVRRGALARLAVRNVARNPGRSSLTIGLVAAATFLIVAIRAPSGSIRRNHTPVTTAGPAVSPWSPRAIRCSTT